MSLGFSYIPGLNTKFASLTKEVKQGIMGGLIVLVGLSIFGLGCLQVQPQFTCDQEGGIGLAKVIVSCLIANQTMFLITPQTAEVKAVKPKTV
jgi:hypothetical protein